jgi:hypothetical protein
MNGRSHVQLQTMKPRRAAFTDLQYDAEAEEATAIVALEWSGRIYEGRASGPAEFETQHRLIGEATLRAIEALSSGKLELELGAMAATQMGSHSRVALAQVHLQPNGERLVGSALVHDGESGEATVRAVLDALNRTLAEFLE